MSARICLTMALAAGVLLAAGPVLAIDSNYFNKINDDYNVAGNWSLGWVPISTDNGYIAGGSTATLSTSAVATVPNILHVGFVGGVAGDGDGTLNVNDAAAILKTATLYVGYANGSAAAACTGMLNLSAGSISVTNSMLIGVGTLPVSPFGSTGAFTQTGGTCSITSGLYLGNVDKASGTLTITGADSLFSASGTYLGNREGSAGLLTVGTAGGADACKLTLGATTVGHGLLNTGAGASGTLTVQGAGTCTVTSLTVGGGTSTGIAATGYVYVKDNAAFSATSTVSVGNYATGVFEQSGGSATLATASNYIGRYVKGNGTYNISGGTLNVSSTSGSFYLAYTAGGTGTMNVSGTASVILGAKLYVGISGNGAYGQTGGTMTANNNVYVGYNATSHGTLSVGGGTDIALFSATATGKDIYVGYNGEGALSLGDNGSFDAGANKVYFGYNATGTSVFTQAGGTFTAGGLVVGNTGAGTFNLSGGVANLPGGAVTGAGTFNFQGGTLLNVGTVGMAVNLAGGGTGAVFQQDAGFAGLVSGKISGMGALTKTGDDALTLSAANDYIGLTTLSAGTLKLVGLDAISSPGAWNPVLNLGGANIAGGQLVFDYTGGSDPASTIAGLLGTKIYTTVAGKRLSLTDNTANYNVILALVAALFPGDADGNGTVNGADLNVVLSNYNQTGMNWSQGDFDGNGTVNGADLNVVLSNYNQSAPVTAAVPEPSMLLLAAAGLAGLLAYACRKRFTVDR